MIVDTIQQKIGEAMKARDEIRLSTLRMLSSALNYEKIAKQHDLTEMEEIVVVRREAKKRQDAIEALRLAQGKNVNEQVMSIEDRIAKEEQELEILKGYLPQELTDTELNDIVEKAIASTGASGMQDMGKVMGAATEMVGGRSEGKKVAELVKAKLTS